MLGKDPPRISSKVTGVYIIIIVPMYNVSCVCCVRLTCGQSGSSSSSASTE